MFRSPSKLVEDDKRASRSRTYDQEKMSDKLEKVCQVEDMECERCTICCKLVEGGQNGIICDKCNKWFHAGCQDISVPSYKQLVKLDEIVDWSCKECKRAEKEIFQHMKEIVEENKKIRKENADLKLRIDGIENNISGMKNDIVEKIKKEVTSEMKDIRKLMEDISGKMSNHEKNDQAIKIEDIYKLEEGIKKHVLENLHEEEGKIRQSLAEEINKRNNDLIDEFKRLSANNNVNPLPQEINIEALQDNIMINIRKEEDRKRRAKNIVIFNMPENEAESENEYENREFRSVDQILQKLNMSGINIRNIMRLGEQKEDRSRPTLVTFSNTKEKWDVMKRAKFLGASQEYRMIRIAPDLNVEDREKERKLLQELKQKRESGEKGWYIKKGQLIQGVFPQL